MNKLDAHSKSVQIVWKQYTKKKYFFYHMRLLIFQIKIPHQMKQVEKV